MDEMNSMVRDHPAAVMLVFGLLLAVSKLALGFILWWGKREFASMKATELEQDQKLERLHRDASTLTSIKDKLELHVLKEETVWEEIREISVNVRLIQSKMPNGDLRSAIAKLDQVAQDLREHNRDAEKLKITMAAHTVRLDTLEK
jgi:hypothetical protein